MRADRDKEIALANADLQKQLTGNESAHTTAVSNANSAHSTATANAEAARKSAEQAALTQLNSTLAQATKDKEASIAGAERLYDQAVASLDAQYGSASSNGDTGVEGATRRSAIKTRDAQYYAARDTSWANTLSASTTLGTTPWTVKAISAANSQAAFSASLASAQAAHDAAMLDAMEDWKLSSRESLTDLLFTEGQSRETYNVATSNVYANWENGVGNLLGDKPEGTGYVPVRAYGEGGVGTLGPARRGNFTGFKEDEEGTATSGEVSEDVVPSRPSLPASETNSNSPIVFLTQQQWLELERQYGADYVVRLKAFYRIRDPNIGFYNGDLITSIGDVESSKSIPNKSSKKRIEPGKPGYGMQEIVEPFQAEMKRSLWNFVNPESDGCVVWFGLRCIYVGVFIESRAAIMAAHDAMRTSAVEAAAESKNGYEQAAYTTISYGLNAQESFLLTTNRFAEGGLLITPISAVGLTPALASPYVAVPAVGYGSYSYGTKLYEEGITPENFGDGILLGAGLLQVSRQPSIPSGAAAYPAMSKLNTASPRMVQGPVYGNSIRRNDEFLTETQIAELRTLAGQVGLGPEDLQFVRSPTCYSPDFKKVLVGPNVLPSEESVAARSVFGRLTPRVVLAHEHGHMLTSKAGLDFEGGSLLDEVQASLVARQLRGLSNQERMQLLRDAVERARIEGKDLRTLLPQLHYFWK